MAKQSDAPGCRSAAISTGLLVGVAVVFMIIGLTLVNDTSCGNGCQTLGFTMLYAGLPISAIFGVVFGDLVVAWPMDITFWVIIGFVLARFADNRGRSVLGPSLVTVIAALLYGLVLSQFVEIAI